MILLGLLLLGIVVGLIALTIVGVRHQASRRVPRISLCGVVILVLAIVVVVMSPLSGYFPAKFDLIDSHLAADSSTRTVTQTYVVENQGWFSEHIRALGVSTAGIEVLRTSGQDREMLRNQTMDLVVVYHVSDCANAPSSPVPIHIRTDHPWGAETSTIVDEGSDLTNTARDVCQGSR